MKRSSQPFAYQVCPPRQSIRIWSGRGKDNQAPEAQVVFTRKAILSAKRAASERQEKEMTMYTYVITRANGWANPEELKAAADDLLSRLDQ